MVTDGEFKYMQNNLYQKECLIRRENQALAMEVMIMAKGG